MTTSTFDTLAAARALEAAKFSREQAEAIAQAIRNGQGNLATKADLDTAIAGLETRLVKWGYGLGATVVALTVTLNAGLMYAMLRLLPLAGPGP
ncbi:MAG: hypothetical protein OXC65_15175 [Thiotrichales bacterium]|nr:hypothetical protein [Thiotrichales bacterium]